MLKHCLKCGHANPCATGAELEACPECGAIYSRVEAAMAARVAARRTTTPEQPGEMAQAMPMPAAGFATCQGGRTCLKCGHINAAANGGYLEECPGCGAIYTKVERAHAERQAALAYEQAVLAALVISMLLAPIIVQHSDRIVMRFAASEWLMRSLQLTTLAARTMREEKHAVICGFGRSGQYLARFMAREGVGYVALDLDPDRVREATAAGEHVVYGNATRREMLIAAGIKRASVLVITFSDLRAAENVLRQVREINPALPVVVRTIDDKDFDVLQRAGAAEVVPETLESSMMLASHALIHAGVPIGRVLKQIRQTRVARCGLRIGQGVGLGGGRSQGYRYHDWMYRGRVYLFPFLFR